MIVPLYRFAANAVAQCLHFEVQNLFKIILIYDSFIYRETQKKLIKANAYNSNSIKRRKMK